MKKIIKSEENQLISPKEAAGMIQVGYSTIQRWIDAGKVPAHKTLGGHRRIMKRDLLDFAESKNIPIFKEVDSQENISVLIVDDDQSMLDIISEFIRNSYPDLNILVANNAFKAGLMVEKSSPHLVFLDILMPGVSGIDFCQMLKSNSNTSEIEIVGITGSKSKRVQETLTEAGASEILLKPIKPEMIEDVIGRLVLGK